MFKKIKKRIHKLMDWYDHKKGSRYFKLKSIQESPDDGYIITTDQGFKIFIYCKEYAYVCIFLNKWALDKQLSVYHVYCVCSEDTPADVKVKFKSELKISAFLNKWSSKESQKMQAIKAYVDLVLKGEI